MSDSPVRYVIEEEQVLATSTSSINNYSNNTIDFILNSRATIHTCYIKELFTSIKPTTVSIKWGNTDKSIKAAGIGDISLVFTSTNKLVKLTNVLYIPELGVNLLSLNLITSKGFNLLFNKNSCYITTLENSLLAKGSYKKGVSYFTASSNKVIPINYRNRELIVLNSIEEEEEQDITIEEYRDIRNTANNSNNNSNKETIVVNNNTIDLAHKRLGHINLSAIKKLQSTTKEDFINIEDIKTASTSLKDCITCIHTKLTKNVNKTVSTKVKGYLDLLYIDIGGPIRPKTFRGFKYYITFRDSFTKYLVIKLLKTRKSTIDIIKSTIVELELEATNNSNTIEAIEPFNNNKVKALQLDNEFKSRELDSYLTNKGINTRYSAPYTPEQNGAAEIINRVLLNKVRALLITSNLPKYLWGEAILTATYLYNRTPNSSINFSTPYNLKYKEKPNKKILGSLVP